MAMILAVVVQLPKLGKAYPDSMMPPPPPHLHRTLVFQQSVLGFDVLGLRASGRLSISDLIPFPTRNLPTRSISDNMSQNFHVHAQ